MTNSKKIKNYKLSNTKNKYNTFTNDKYVLKGGNDYNDNIDNIDATSMFGELEKIMNIVKTEEKYNQFYDCSSGDTNNLECNKFTIVKNIYPSVNKSANVNDTYMDANYIYNEKNTNIKKYNIDNIFNFDMFQLLIATNSIKNEDFEKKIKDEKIKISNNFSKMIVQNNITDLIILNNVPGNNPLNFGSIIINTNNNHDDMYINNLDNHNKDITQKITITTPKKFKFLHQQYLKYSFNMHIIVINEDEKIDTIIKQLLDTKNIKVLVDDNNNNGENCIGLFIIKCQMMYYNNQIDKYKLNSQILYLMLLRNQKIINLSDYEKILDYYLKKKKESKTIVIPQRPTFIQKVKSIFTKTEEKENFKILKFSLIKNETVNDNVNDNGS